MNMAASLTVIMFYTVVRLAHYITDNLLWAPVHFLWSRRYTCFVMAMMALYCIVHQSTVALYSVPACVTGKCSQNAQTRGWRCHRKTDVAPAHLFFVFVADQYSAVYEMRENRSRTGTARYLLAW